MAHDPVKVLEVIKFSKGRSITMIGNNEVIKFIGLNAEGVTLASETLTILATDVDIAFQLEKVVIALRLVTRFAFLEILL